MNKPPATSAPTTARAMHYCKAPAHPTNVHANDGKQSKRAEITHCTEVDGGFYVVQSEQSTSFVNCCPFCGSPAPLKPADVPAFVEFTAGDTTPLPAALTKFCLTLNIDSRMTVFLVAVSSKDQQTRAAHSGELSIFDGAIANRPGRWPDPFPSFDVDLAKLPADVCQLVLLAGEVHAIDMTTCHHAAMSTVTIGTAHIHIARSVCGISEYDRTGGAGDCRSVVAAIIERTVNGWTFNAPWKFSETFVQSLLKQYGA